MYRYISVSCWWNKSSSVIIITDTCWLQSCGVSKWQSKYRNEIMNTSCLLNSHVCLKFDTIFCLDKVTLRIENNIIQMVSLVSPCEYPCDTINKQCIACNKHQFKKESQDYFFQTYFPPTLFYKSKIVWVLFKSVMRNIPYIYI